MVPHRWKVPIFIVAVNHIEVIEYIDWLYNELNIYGGGFEPLISSCWFFLRNPILLFLNLIYQCAEMKRWLFYTKNVQFENVSFFIKVSDEEKFLLFQHGELTVNQRCFLIGMLDARMRIHDNTDPNWAIEVCKWSVTITICSLPYTGKSKELDYVGKSVHEVICVSNHPPWYQANQYGQYNLLQQWKWVLFTFEAP